MIFNGLLIARGSLPVVMERENHLFAPSCNYSLNCSILILSIFNYFMQCQIYNYISIYFTCSLNFCWSCHNHYKCPCTNIKF
jgi:hypothetical protein